MNDVNYQSMSHIAADLPSVKQITTTNKVPLPPEIMEHFDRILLLHFFRLFSLMILFRDAISLHDGVVSGN